MTLVGDIADFGSPSRRHLLRTIASLADVPVGWCSLSIAGGSVVLKLVIVIPGANVADTTIQVVDNLSGVSLAELSESIGQVVEDFGAVSVEYFETPATAHGAGGGGGGRPDPSPGQSSNDATISSPTAITSNATLIVICIIGVTVLCCCVGLLAWYRRHLVALGSKHRVKRRNSEAAAMERRENVVPHMGMFARRCSKPKAGLFTLSISTGAAAGSDKPRNSSWAAVEQPTAAVIKTGRRTPAPSPDLCGRSRGPRFLAVARSPRDTTARSPCDASGQRWSPTVIKTAGSYRVNDSTPPSPLVRSEASPASSMSRV
ncbi:hypothetical protein T492DRAFT_1073297 [Pavlovales sp. CCMP2436]|nr:hypothetical protein T492DRAFT_1073297 [Pavlovales sp. CCMP2436]